MITGATGYLGRALIGALATRGHRVRALVRPGSEGKLPAKTPAVIGNPLHAASVAAAFADADTLVHLVGVSKPGPAKARQFRAIDLVSIQASAEALAQVARERPGAPAHLVYLSVAQPAPVMRAYVDARAAGEAFIRARRLDATFLRPWYVLGPGHRWPVVLLPLYALLRRVPATRAAAERLGFVTLTEMTAALVHAVENPARGVRLMEVPEIRACGARARQG